MITYWFAVVSFIFAVLLFCGGTTVCLAGEAQMTLKRRAELAATNLAGQITQEKLARLLIDMTGDDPTAAKTAVQKLADLGATNVIVVALEYPASSVQIEAAKQLMPIANKAILPHVVSALETANGDLLKGGSEVVLANRDLKQKLLSLIENITKLDFANISVKDTDAIQNVIGTTREWMRKEKQKETKR